MSKNTGNACVLAALCLEEAKKETTADAIAKIVTDSGIKSADVKQWAAVFSEYLKNTTILELLAKFGTGSASAAPAAAAAAPKEEAKKEKTEEEEIIGGFGFGDDDD